MAHFALIDDVQRVFIEIVALGLLNFFLHVSNLHTATAAGKLRAWPAKAIPVRCTVLSYQGMIDLTNFGIILKV